MGVKCWGWLQPNVRAQQMESHTGNIQGTALRARRAGQRYCRFIQIPADSRERGEKSFFSPINSCASPCFPGRADSIALWKRACVCVQSLQSCLTLCHPMFCSPPDSSVHGTLQARILERVAIPSSGGSSRLRGWTWVSCTAGRFFTTEPPGRPWSVKTRHRLMFRKATCDPEFLDSSNPNARDRPGCPVVIFPCFQFRGCGFNPWSGN